MGLEQLKRNNYFYGRLLTADDVAVEQQYYLEKHRRHNRYLHGWGIVSGLEFSLLTDDSDAILISPGFAIDCFGNEILVSKPVQLRVPRFDGISYLSIRYVEQQTDPVPLPGAEGNLQYTHTEEGFEITFEKEDSLVQHGPEGARYVSCGRPHPIPLGQLKDIGGRLTINRRFRPPRVKREHSAA